MCHFIFSKLKSPIKASPIGSCTGSNRENHDISTDHENLVVREKRTSVIGNVVSDNFNIY